MAQQIQEVDTLTLYGSSFQSKVLSALLIDAKLLHTLDGIIHKKFFDSEASKWIVDQIVEYYGKYKKAPTMDVFKVEIERENNPSLKKNGGG